MPNYPDQYFNQNTSQARPYSDQNTIIVKEEIVSGASTDKIYVAQLVKLVGASVNLTTGDINVNLDASTDSVQLGGADNESHIGAVGGNSIQSQIIIRRPANATQYSVGDILNSGGSISEIFHIARVNGKSVMCVGGKCSSNFSASTAADIDLHIYKSSFTIGGDNKLFTPSGGTAGSLSALTGTINFTTWKTQSNAAYSVGAIETPFIIEPESGSKEIYALAVLQNTYTPVANEVFSFTLDLDQN